MSSTSTTSSRHSGDESAVQAMAPTPNTAAVPVFGVGERSTCEYDTKKLSKESNFMAGEEYCKARRKSPCYCGIQPKLALIHLLQRDVSIPAQFEHCKTYNVV
ncbi:unnamed protein product [Bursaphelenchus xylophilus]|uniref:(pine wood nematode) hypothetical protein n=1 Tax=Bursaphelenchus xylophilus TaxID=6326 RepID=A0A7I8XQ49_BURXY|nr:unnamed protein product [Bursaphelenchus xylophilus]CAG9088091.1 unnamed protein product [Bursaphelenchus xylophilus]